jgi:hypothetical protein
MKSPARFATLYPGRFRVEGIKEDMGKTPYKVAGRGPENGRQPCVAGPIRVEGSAGGPDGRSAAQCSTGLAGSHEKYIVFILI